MEPVMNMPFLLLIFISMISHIHGQAEEPKLCSLIRVSQEVCSNAEVARQCPQRCSQIEGISAHPITEEPLCSLMSQEDCSGAEVARQCPQRCSQIEGISAQPVTEEPLCSLISQESCSSAEAAAQCPQRCSQSQDPAWCSFIRKDGCLTVAEQCPQRCSQKSDPFWCSLMKKERCSTAAVYCPQKCSQGANPTTGNVESESEVSCGYSTKLGGRKENDTMDGIYPWMVYLNYHSFELNQPIHCGGTLIAKRWILTSAICFKYLKQEMDVFVKTGFVNIKQRKPESNLFLINLNDIIYHEEFNSTTLVNNIALIRLPYDVEMNNLTQTICLGTNRNIPFGGTAITAGWGLLSQNDPDIPNTLHETEFGIIPEANCPSPQHLICTSKPGTYSCSGDGGGPLMVQEDDQWYQIGILSQDPLGCGDINTQEVYTRVPNYLSFINGVIMT